ncbi:Ammonium transporter [Vagococcus luciliae]|uniref:Ammonium transporter n=2 Tax=Vagococcus luciliae TaxID=2920380 RepID=A0ABY5NYR5_9ENTE|nr:Ammonium transporter [Vagococcus luciliae]
MMVIFSLGLSSILWIILSYSLSFSGGNVVHISSGITGLVLAIVLGAGLLWFGWFGFNSGSALGANKLAIHALLVTHSAAAIAMLSWMLIEKTMIGKPTIVGASTGAIVGLVAITPGAGFVPLWSALIIGFLVSPVCYISIGIIKRKLEIDDALDAFGCHGVGGIATGIFAEKSIGGVNGLLYGGLNLFIAQLISILITLLFAGLVSFIIIKIINVFMPIRVSERDEIQGLDVTEHDETAYPTFFGMDN